MTSFLNWHVVIAISFLVACEDPPAETCRAGDTRACTCETGRAGTQACTAAGTWSACDCGGSDGDSDVDIDADADADEDVDVDIGLVWPNAESSANSDPWLSEHHGEIRQMRPRVLALNFVNARSMSEMHDQLTEMSNVIAEASRYHGYDDPAAPPFLVYQLAYEIDLRDETPPGDWPYRNSTIYPREDPADEYWSFDYEQLFSRAFADLYGIEDPSSPGRSLDLCELIERGLVHEVWVYGDADVPDVSAAEILELKPRYDESRRRVGTEMNRCAGNGCFDEEDVIPSSCTRTVRIAWFNNTRGPGCFLESLSHGFESIGAWNPEILPTLSRDFIEFAAYRLNERYGVPFDSFYACPEGDCFSYPTETSVAYDIGTASGVIDPYDPVCGNVHFPPNGRHHYDQESSFRVQCSCETFGVSAELRPFTRDRFSQYFSLAPDCMGAFLVYWRQSFPGLDSGAQDSGGRPILNWWPYVFY